MTTQARAALRAAIEARRAATAEVARLRDIERRGTQVVEAATALAQKAQAAVDAGVADAGAALATSLSDGAVDADSIAAADDAAIADKMRADSKLAAALAAHRKVLEDLQAAEKVEADSGNAVRAAARSVIVSEIEEVADDLEVLEQRRRYLRAQIQGAAQIWVPELPTHHLNLSNRAIALLSDNYVSHALPDSNPASPVSVATTKWAAYLPRLLADAGATLTGPPLRLVPRDVGGDAA